jgi:hypothetical protein
MVRTSGTDDEPQTVSNTGFAFSTHSAISTSRITLNGSTVAEDPQKTSIRPMRLSEVTSVHEVTFTRDGQPFGLAELDSYGWQLAVVRQDLPGALWGPPLDSTGRADRGLPDRQPPGGPALRGAAAGPGRRDGSGDRAGPRRRGPARRRYAAA